MTLDEIKNKAKMIKFNGGNPVVICSHCRVIIRYATLEEIKKPSSPEYCKHCKKKKAP